MRKRPPISQLGSISFGGERKNGTPSPPTHLPLPDRVDTLLTMGVGAIRSLVTEKATRNLEDKELHIQGHIALRQGDAIKAEECFSQCLEREPACISALAGMASIAIIRNDWLRASRFLTREILVSGVQHRVSRYLLLIEVIQRSTIHTKNVDCCAVLQRALLKHPNNLMLKSLFTQFEDKRTNESRPSFPASYLA